MVLFAWGLNLWVVLWFQQQKLSSDVCSFPAYWLISSCDFSSGISTSERTGSLQPDAVFMQLCWFIPAEDLTSEWGLSELWVHLFMHEIWWKCFWVTCTCDSIGSTFPKIFKCIFWPKHQGFCSFFHLHGGGLRSSLVELCHVSAFVGARVCIFLHESAFSTNTTNYLFFISEYLKN